MAEMASQIPVWVCLAIFGFLLSRRVLRTSDPWLLVGSVIPVALITMLGIFFPLARLAGHPQGWSLGALGTFLATVVLFAKRQSSGAPALEDFGFSPFQWGVFMTMLTAANFVMHTREAGGPEDDYWIHFPLIALLNRGEFPPPNPFFADLALQGHFGRDYIVGILTWLNGGGEAVLTSLWSFNHLLSISAFFLAFGLGRRCAGTAGGFFMSSFLFFGVSVGSRVGLVDTYDNNNLLVYCLLLLFVAIETTLSESLVPDIFLGLALGVYGIVYETHLLLFCMVIWMGPLLWRRRERIHPKDWLRPLWVTGVAVVIAACLGGPLQDLALRALGVRHVKVDYAATYQAQHVRMKFPKKALFQIMLGPESYRRLSYVYQGRAFRGLRESDSVSGVNARTDFHYAFILGKEVLLMHWLALYLGLPAGFWLLRKKMPEGQALWAFGLVSFLVPALVDFGPVHEREYFRWEFGAGFGFAGALAVASALLWRHKSRWVKAAVVVLFCLVILGGESKINKTFIEIHKMPEPQKSRAHSIGYPSPRDWLLGSPELRMTPSLLDAAHALRKRSRPTDRMLCDLDARTHWEIFQESTVAAIAGLRSVGHVSPPPWMPDGIAPFFRTASWNAFWQTGDERILPFLDSRWLLVSDPHHAALLEGKKDLKQVERFGDVSLWRYDGELGALEAEPPSGARVSAIERPSNRELRSEVALPMELTLEGVPDKPFDLGVTWLPEPGTEPGGPIEPLKVRCRPGQKSYRQYLVAPLVEGKYRLRFTINGHEIPSVESDAVLEFDWTREAKMATVDSFVGDEVAFEPVSPNLKPPLRLGLRLFRLDESRYSKPFGFEAVGIWNGGSKVKLEPTEPGFDFHLPDTVRGDLFLMDRSGREVLLPAAGSRSLNSTGPDKT